MSTTLTEAALCACGCGEPSPIATQTRRELGHVQGRPTRYKRGHWARGKTWSAEHRAKIAAAKTGALNYAWKGDEAGYQSVHTWIRKNYPKTGICEACGEERKTEWSNRDHTYRRVREDWQELCVPCHAIYDRDHLGRFDGRRVAA